MDLTGSALDGFAAEVGPVEAGPVTCIGGRTQWAVGWVDGGVDSRRVAGSVGSVGSVREVAAPAGVVAHEPAEMIVRVRAGTTLAELDAATAAGGQYVALEAGDAGRATVGGVLSCGLSGVRRLGRGAARDTVLEVTAVSARGELIRAGAPLVKNVTGFDLCRLVVGSVGTLAFLGEVVLRCHPRPEVESWWCSDPEAAVDPFPLLASLYRPLALLWDGRRVWVGLAGQRIDVEDQAGAVLGRSGRFSPAPGPPALPTAGRRSMSPGRLRSLPSALAGCGWVAEIGVGVVHCDERAAGALDAPAADPGLVELHRRIKARFDPTARMNPGRSPLAPAPLGTVGAA